MLSEKERERYRRQIPLFGEEGQNRLKNAHVFIAGAGGLGSPVAIYLAVAGVGTLTIVDNDAVELTNLNRQILHRDCDRGRPKVDSAVERLREINPDINVRGIQTTLEGRNIRSLVGDADGIIDAVDNYPLRYLLNETALSMHIPLFHGAIRGFNGQATTIIPPRTACLRCIFPQPPPVEVFPVIGVTAGYIAMVQANEAIKYIVQCGELLTNRLLLWDGLESRAEEIRVDKNLFCCSCGTCRGAAGT